MGTVAVSIGAGITNIIAIGIAVAIGTMIAAGATAAAVDFISV
jgi:hypothetical protein